MKTNATTLLLIFGIFMLSANAATAQRHQYNFAQTYLGIEGNYLSSLGPAAEGAGAARMVFGGTHFWYRADFYISFPLSTFATGGGAMDYSEGVITGARCLPFGPGQKWPMPFAGVAWATPRLQSGEGPELQRSRLAFDAGLSLVAAGKYTLEASLRYMHRADAVYPTGRGEVAVLRPPRYTFTIAAKRYFDFTAGIATPQGQAWMKAADAYYSEHGGLSTWFGASGLSANVVLAPYPFAEALPFLPEIPAISLGPDIAAGYHFHRADLDLLLSYRSFGTGQEGHGYAWELREHRIGLEANKFIIDYKGFIPFVGAHIGTVFQSFAAEDFGEPLARGSAWAPAAGVVLGWDIRPARTDWFILRTNTRIVWTSGGEIAGFGLRSRHFEVNFIQMVIYPERLSKLKHIQP